MAKEIISASPGGGLVPWADYKGKLFVIEPTDFEKDVKTVHGTGDAVRGDVFVLTGPETSEDYEDTLIFPRVLVSQLRKKIDKVVVGRLDQGEARKGQNAPWKLLEASDKDIEKAKAFLARRSVSSVGSADEPEDDFGDTAEEAF